MERREFLQALGAAALVPVLPLALPADVAPAVAAVADPPPVVAVLNADWFCIVHPSVESDLREMVARDDWQTAYRAYRSQKYAWKELTPAEILRHCTPKPLRGEMPRLDGIRFVSTAPFGAFSGVPA